MWRSLGGWVEREWHGAAGPVFRELFSGDDIWVKTQMMKRSHWWGQGDWMHFQRGLCEGVDRRHRRKGRQQGRRGRWAAFNSCSGEFGFYLHSRWRFLKLWDNFELERAHPGNSVENLNPRGDQEANEQGLHWSCGRKGCLWDSCRKKKTNNWEVLLFSKRGGGSKNYTVFKSSPLAKTFPLGVTGTERELKREQLFPPCNLICFKPRPCTI